MIQIKTTIEITMPSGDVLRETSMIERGNNVITKRGLLAFYLLYKTPRELIEGLNAKIKAWRKSNPVRTWGRAE